ncbi:MAG: hypothetical protein ACRD82_08630, partial [Blastocatellia bacterium]
MVAGQPIWDRIQADAFTAPAKVKERQGLKLCGLFDSRHKSCCREFITPNDLPKRLNFNTVEVSVLTSI